MVNASAGHIGALCSSGGGRRTLGSHSVFFSRKLDSAQVKHSAFDRELLACFQAICHFCFMLEGRRFTLFPNHKPLTTAGRWSREQPSNAAQLTYIAEFTCDIQHIAGSDNVVADTRHRRRQVGVTAGTDRGDKKKIKLSTSSGGLRSSVEALPEVNAMRATTASVDYAALTAHLGACPLTQRAASSTSLQVEKRVVGGVELLCDISRGGVRPLVPLVDRPAIFAAFHGLAHAGTQATKRLIAVASTVTWPHGSRTVSSVREPRFQGNTRRRCSPSPSQPDISPISTRTSWARAAVHIFHQPQAAHHRRSTEP
jgi:hypothetical protein